MNGELNEINPLIGVLGEPDDLYGSLDGPLTRGYSAYEIYLEHGGTMTVEEWLASLKGEKGDEPSITTQRTGSKQTTIYADGEQIGIILDGQDGDPGEPGDDGFSPTVETAAITGGHSVTITDASGPHTFNVMDGQDGAPGRDGQPGADGYSPSASVTKSGKTATISITDKSGTTTATVSDGQDGQDGQDGSDGYTPVKGTDYWTASDKAEMESDILQSQTITDIQSDITSLSGDITELDGYILDIQDELGWNTAIGPANPLVVDASQGTTVNLEFTTASSFHKSGVNLLSGGSFTFSPTKTIALPATYPAGKYTFSAVVTSGDADASVSVVRLYNGSAYVTTESEGSMQRGSRKSVTLTATGSFNSIILFASTDYIKSVGDTATFADAQLEVGESASTYTAYSGEDVSLSGTSTNIVTTSNKTVLVSNDGSNITARFRGNTSGGIIPQLEDDFSDTLELLAQLKTAIENGQTEEAINLLDTFLIDHGYIAPDA